MFAGWPNAGKSSLINALARQNRAVVSDLAGTTRDVLTARMNLPRGSIQLADFAGIESNPLDTIQRSMQQNAAAAIQAADQVILVRDITDNRPAPAIARKVHLLVLTKADLLQNARGEVHPLSGDIPTLTVSVHTSQGMNELRETLDALAFGSDRTGATLALNRRHIAAINTVRESLGRAQLRVIENAPELVAMDLRNALDALGSVVGVITRDDVLGRIFSAFCIGK